MHVVTRRSLYREGSSAIILCPNAPDGGAKTLLLGFEFFPFRLGVKSVLSFFLISEY